MFRAVPCRHTRNTTHNTSTEFRRGGRVTLGCKAGGGDAPSHPLTLKTSICILLKLLPPPEGHLRPQSIPKHTHLVAGSRHLGSLSRGTAPCCSVSDIEVASRSILISGDGAIIYHTINRMQYPIYSAHAHRAKSITLFSSFWWVWAL